MERVISVCAVICAMLGAVAAESSVCEGIWKIDKIEKCENYQQYPIVVEVLKRKMDRTTDWFSIEMELPEDFGPEYALQMESFEKCDGGYKASDVITGGACNMLNEFAKENFQQVLAKADIEPRDCPIAKGKYTLLDYVIDYESLPEQGKCGDYKWEVYLIKNGKKESCIRAYTSFTAKEEDD